MKSLSVKVVERLDDLRKGSRTFHFAMGLEITFVAGFLEIAGINRTQSKTVFVGFDTTPLM